jgi:hypothetical protein
MKCVFFCPKTRINEFFFNSYWTNLDLAVIGVSEPTYNHMKSRKNLTRFTYETTAFQGWRLSLSRSGTTFTKYFSDKKYGSERKALNAAEGALKALKELVDSSRKVNGKLSKTTINKGQKLLKDA